MSTRCHCCDNEIVDGENLAPGVLYQLSLIENGDLVWCNYKCYKKDKSYA